MDQDEKTVDTALRAAERMYDEEDARFRQSEQKAAAVLAVAGILLTIFARQPPTVTEGCFGLVLQALTLGTFLALAVSIINGLIALSPRTAFKRVNPGDLASDETLAYSSEKLKKALLKRYSENIAENSQITERKMDAIWWSVVSVSAGLLLMLLATILQMVQH